MLLLFLWITIFAISLVVMVKGSDYLVQGAERIGLALGMSPFVIGVVIVGIGTSFPELVSSMTAALQGVTEIVVANAVGSNVANIFLIVGAAAVIGKKLVIEKDLIDLDLPLIAISTVLFLGVVYDGKVVLAEAILLLIAYLIHFSYTIFYQKEISDMKRLPLTVTRRLMGIVNEKKNIKSWKKPKIGLHDAKLIIFGVIGLGVGAKYLVDSVINISNIFGVGAGALTIVAVAFGTSLPELLVSVRAALMRKSDIALGNIFGSNAFNILVVVGLPGLFTSLSVDATTLMIGVPTMVLATLLFVISGISRRIHSWEGAMYLVAYALFVGKIFQLF